MIKPENTLFGKDTWLTREFLASAKQGQKLPDDSVHIQLNDGSHWAIAVDVATPRDYGWELDLGAVGQWIAGKNASKAHGHANWKMPNRAIGKKLYDLREQEGLKVMFASVRGLWLAEISNSHAGVQRFDTGSQTRPYRHSRNSVCAVRRLDNWIIRTAGFGRPVSISNE
jgi:hypothetical protein